MIRVGFVIEGPSFLGSVNYLRNLFSALAQLPGRQVQPVLFAGSQTSEKMLVNFRDAEIVKSTMLDDGTLIARARWRLNRLFPGRDPLLRILLNRHGVKVLSHSGPLRNRSIKTIAWIPDFQHIYLPAFFHKEEHAMRNDDFHAIAHHSDVIVLSSEAARSDLAAFAPAAVSKSRILRFVPAVDTFSDVIPIAELQQKYQFRVPFFYVPNQFWIHKNHKLIMEALVELKAKGIEATVVMTGSTEDYRHPSHISELMAHVEQNGLSESFKVLGLVPYEDLLSLMHHALAIMNPSLFEGWSTSVEEAKALDKIILLSSLPVHLEQNPERGIFFDPTNAHDLTEKMEIVMCQALLAPAAGTKPIFSKYYKTARQNFAKTYEEIVVQCVGSAN